MNFGVRGLGVRNVRKGWVDQSERTRAIRSEESKTVHLLSVPAWSLQHDCAFRFANDT